MGGAQGGPASSQLRGLASGRSQKSRGEGQLLTLGGSHWKLATQEPSRTRKQGGCIHCVNLQSEAAKQLPLGLKSSSLSLGLEGKSGL